MSLNAVSRRRTAHEFEANLAASGITRSELRERTGLDERRFDAAFAVRVGVADPVDVWLVRDALERAVRDAHAPLTEFSVLTEQMRAAAAGWFGVRDQR